MTRVHQADAVPCPGCGAPLAVDVSSAWSWCRACHAWRPVPEELRRAVWERWNALASARAAHAQEEQLARHQKSAAAGERLKSGALTLVLAVVAAVFVLPALASLALYAVGAVLVAFDELEPWAAILLTIVAGAAALGFVAAFVGVCVFLYRRATRHRRWSRLGSDPEWYGREHGARPAPLTCCGECGAPLWFRAGEHAVECGHCRSVVIAPDEHADSVFSLALSELQLARRARARAERALLRAKVATARRAVVLRTWFVVGSLAFLAVPVLAFGYAVRALTPSLEEAMLSLSKQLRGEFGSGLEPPFDWLDRYWIGVTPPTFEAQGTFTSRWSIAGAFHGRPVLLSVLASWTDLWAREAVVVLASPRERDASRVMLSAAARTVQGMGWQIYVDYPGIALVAGSQARKKLTLETATALARAAYELAEER
ncbi:MAG: hypothetical protein HS104_01245 [Polyangiaceae bacterium]|nr:hypothetical protein [Polyangiaceae bacterium]MCE7894165.1 hypothetical protein [Sorangiineae bacterium PRO1]MCL4752728.1 hypothetical protein [Myxococcales bacterium]